MEQAVYDYTYVREPFDDVAELLATDPIAVLQPATNGAVSQAAEIVTTLHINVGGTEIGRDVRIEVGEFVPDRIRHVKLPLQWRAARSPALFPSLEGDLEVEALSLAPPVTQVTFAGVYRPPLGVFGAAGDALVGHRVAEAAIHHFLADVIRGIEVALEARRQTHEHVAVLGRRTEGS